MKKIMIVNKYYSPDIGGVETVVKQHAHLLKDEYQISVLCISKKFSIFTRRECIDGVNVLRCSSLGTFFSMPLSISFFLHYFYGFLKSDLIINHCPFPLMDVAFFCVRPFVKNKKNIIFWHSDIVKQKILKKILSPFINHSLRKTSLILTTSPNLRDKSPQLHRFKSKVYISPLFVDSAYIKKHIYSLDCNPQKYDFMFFGRLCYYKGIDVLLDSLVKLKQCGLNPLVFIAGDGELSGLVKKNIAIYDLSNVIFENRFLSEREKYMALISSKCFLFPSVVNSEAFGITQLEAMALGVPVINTNLDTGVPYVSVDNLTGITVTPNDSEALANAMMKIMNDENIRLYFSQECKIRIAKVFEQHIVAAKFKDIVRELLEN